MHDCQPIEEREHHSVNEDILFHLEYDVVLEYLKKLPTFSRLDHMLFQLVIKENEI